MLEPMPLKKSYTGSKLRDFKTSRDEIDLPQHLSKKNISETLNIILGKENLALESLQENPKLLAQIHSYIYTYLASDESIVDRDSIVVAIRICNVLNKLSSEDLMLSNALGRKDLEVHLRLFDCHVRQGLPLNPICFSLIGSYASNSATFEKTASLTAPLLFALLNPGESMLVMREALKKYKVVNVYVKFLRELFSLKSLRIKPGKYVRAEGLSGYRSLELWETRKKGMLFQNDLELLLNQLFLLAPKEELLAVKLTGKEQQGLVNWIQSLIISSTDFQDLTRLKTDIMSCSALEKPDRWFNFWDKSVVSPKEELLTFIQLKIEKLNPYSEPMLDSSIDCVSG